ncbi:MAG: hypothetical protein IKU07_02810 [Oscillospiraceae bacterium]|nr:hypothetical protein [Oscillospiraceae bacterium]
MGDYNATDKRLARERRRPKTRVQIFKENYLPAIIGCVTVILIVIFLIGSIVRGIQKSQVKNELKQQEAIALEQAQNEMDSEAEAILQEATMYASQFDYQRAIACIESFSGEMANYPEMQDCYDSYLLALDELVLWDDPAAIVNLSFQMLMAEPTRCYNNTTYGTSYNKNFVTVDEFQKILQQLYDNDFILVDIDDITDGNGAKELYLPAGKKPLTITQTNVNYYRYMIDGDGDWMPDSNGAGFATKLVINENGMISCEMVDQTGATVTGYYDLVPILESFITTHPDFSYKGARALLAVTGYDGIFGYRTSPEAAEKIGQAHYQQEVDNAQRIVSKLQQLGYDFACYTYENEPYGTFNAQQISEEMQKWSSEVTPILGETDIFVFSRNSDLENPGLPYTDDRSQVLMDAGYTRYLGFCDADQSWFYADEGYIRMGRILVTGSSMAYHPEWYSGLFDATAILDPDRGTVPG